MHYPSACPLKGCTRLLFVVSSVVLLTACTASGSALPQRAFETTDLLPSRAETPPNWVFNQPYKPADHLCATDCAEIDGELSNGGVASVAIYRYANAQVLFDEVLFPSLLGIPTAAPVEGWTYTSPWADESRISCTSTSSKSTPICYWAARYEEYVLLISAPIGPGETSLVDLDPLARAADSHVASHLGRVH